ncbi:MAG TPA: YbaK/EbsC family protein [Nitrospira sp.]|nr:YbaK/EbsC family protein [Nitrospira sp.]
MPIPHTLKSCLDREHIHYDILAHSHTDRARAVAEKLHLPKESMAKVVIVNVQKRFVTMVLPATTKIDFQRLRGMFGTHRVRLATEEELAQLFPDCEVGAMPPLGTLYGLPVYVDQSLIGDEQILFDGGTHSEAIRMRYWDFAALVFPTVAEFHRTPTPSC